MFAFISKAQKEKLDRVNTALLDLQGRKKELEIQLEQQQLELQNEKRRQSMKLEEEQHKHRIEIQHKEADFVREKKLWEEDKRTLMAQAERERLEFQKSLESEHKLKLQEATTLTKLDSEQKVKQLEITHLRELETLKTKHSSEMSDLKQALAKEYYDRLSVALNDLHTKGNTSTQFIQELALKMFDKAPMLTNIHAAGNIADLREFKQNA